MKLYLNTTSPYARLVNIVCREAGLWQAVETVIVDPWSELSPLAQVTPAGKIPALACDDGEVLVESACISEYLVRLAGQLSMLPGEQARSLERLRLLGLGRAAMDCAFGAVVQVRFEGAGAALARRWAGALPGIIDQIGRLCGAPAARPDLADITVVAALQYIDFRLAQIDWRPGTPALARWLAAMDRHEAVAATRPH